MMILINIVMDFGIFLCRLNEVKKVVAPPLKNFKIGSIKTSLVGNIIIYLSCSVGIQALKLMLISIDCP